MDDKKLILAKKYFETVMHETNEGQEYWSARELMPLLGYDRWENFENVIKKAIKGDGIARIRSSFCFI